MALLHVPLRQNSVTGMYELLLEYLERLADELDR